MSAVVIPAYLGPCPLGLTAGKKLGLPSFWEALPSQDLWKREAQELRGEKQDGTSFPYLGNLAGRLALG